MMLEYVYGFALTQNVSNNFLLGCNAIKELS